MKLYPESAYVQLEFDKVKALLVSYCQSEYARAKAAELRIHTRLEFVEKELRQSHEYRQLLVNQLPFPNDRVFDLSGEIRLLGIPGAVLGAGQFVEIRALAEAMQKLFRWFDDERRKAFPAIFQVISDTRYDKAVKEKIDEVVDETGMVRDQASPALREIRQSLYRRRIELRRLFDKIVSRLNKTGQLTEIEESFMNGRRVLAVFAEHKRTVKGILHGESESRKTVFMEPEETIPLNNAVFELENEESKEVYRILKELTGALSGFAPLLTAWYRATGAFDFIRAKAILAGELKAEFPMVSDRSRVELVEAYHPLLYLYNRKSGKETIPVSLRLDDQQRVLVISGPNAGGKTVTMKTVGLLQMMVQSGLLVPVHPSSHFGIFKQLFIHIGDTQSIEFELSTYSSHLVHMKYFMEQANGRTLFFIDELGSGSDPALGGAFAEVILRELAHRHALGIVTTHYLNLKVMAGKTPGIVNGAMAFDEEHLQPLYRLMVGKPGSSYTFSIAERIGLNRELIAKARALVDEDQYRLDKLLNRTEQELREVEKKERELARLLQENEKLKRQTEKALDRERHLQQLALAKEQNRISEERIAWLRDTERKLRQLLVEWKKEEDKSKVIRQMENLLFNRQEKKVTGRLKSKIESRYREVEAEIRPGVRVMLKKNHQVGEVLELRGKRAVVKVGLLPMQVELKDLRVVEEKGSGG